VRTLSASIFLAGAIALSSHAVAEERSTPVTSVPPEPADAQGWIVRARDLWHGQRDYNGALRAYNRAVDAAPDDPKVRNERGLFFDQMRHIVPDEDEEKFAALAREDYSWVAEHAPNLVVGGVARDALTALDGSTLVQPKTVSCPDEAAKAHDRAESFFAKRQFSEAISEYEKATAACPDSATYWVNFADAYYGLAQYAKAKELFERALAADPWHRSGHRFLADTEGSLGNSEAGLHQAALAVVSDPMYEAGWAALRSFASSTNRDWRRVYSTKTVVEVDPKDPKNVNITIPPPVGKPDAQESADSTAWVGYGMFQALALGEGKVVDVDDAGKVVDRPIDLRALTALDVERMSVKSTLQTVRETKGPSGPFWGMMARADAAGYLDEAIFLHMLDRRLAAEYPAFRDKNGARLAEYLETVIVPKKAQAPAGD
jgi:tetratricopeptide (TPR) repeat protein